MLQKISGGGGALHTKFTIYYNIQRYYFRYKTPWSKFIFENRILLYLLPNIGIPNLKPILIDIYSRG